MFVRFLRAHFHVSVSLKCRSAPGRSNKTKQDFRLTGFPKASFRVSVGTNDGKAPATRLHFGLPYQWAGMR